MWREHDWRTSDEIAYVQGLGLHIRTHATPHERAQLLRQYLAAMPHRREWGHVDPDDVALAATTTLLRTLAD